MIKKGQEIASVARYSKGQLCSYSLFDQEHDHPYKLRRRRSKKTTPNGIAQVPLENEDDTNKLWVIVRYMQGASGDTSNNSLG